MTNKKENADHGIAHHIDIEVAARQIELLTGSRDTPMTWQTFDDNADRKKGSLRKILHGTIGECGEELKALNRAGGGVFFMVQAGDLQGRATDNVKGIRAVFVDCDKPELRPLESIASSGLDPDLIVESSRGKYHAYRLVAGMPLDGVFYAGVQRLLAELVNGDPVVTDLPRVMRLAGSVHQKVKNGIASSPFSTHIHSIRDEVRTTSFDALLCEFGWTLDEVRAAGGKKVSSLRRAKPERQPIKPAPNRSGDPFSLQLADGEGRNAHVASLAGVCAKQGLTLEATVEKVRDWNQQNLAPIDDATIADICQRIYVKEQTKRATPGVMACTELGFAQMLAATYRDQFRYVVDLGAWLAWDGRTWVTDHGDAFVMQAAKALARGLLDKAANESDDHKRAETRKFNGRMETAKALKNAIYLTQSEPGIPVHVSDLDRDPMLLGIDNGVVNLETGLLRIAHPEDLLTQRAFVSYNREATCPRWIRFIDEITCEDEELAGYLQRLAGYCCTGRTNEHAMVLLVGGGSNGKSVFTKVLSDLLGMYSTRLPSSALAVRRGNDAMPTEVASLKGARMALASELPAGMQLNDALIKALTSEDSITGRLLYKNAFIFNPTHKLVVASNHLPIVAATDNGVWRRLKVMRFKATFDEQTRDPRLIEQLMAESSGILNWLIKGVSQWKERGLETPRSIKEWTGEYRASLDVIGQFIEGACLLATDDPENASSYRVQASVVFDAYTQFARANGLPHMSGRAFGDEMAKRFERTTSAGNRIYKGISVYSTWVSDFLREKIGPANLQRAGVFLAVAEPFVAVID